MNRVDPHLLKAHPVYDRTRDIDPELGGKMLRGYLLSDEAVTRVQSELRALHRVAERYARHDVLCHKLDRDSLASHEQVCTCGLDEALADAK